MELNSSGQINQSLIIVACMMIGVVVTGTAIYGLQEAFYWQTVGVPVEGLLYEKYTDEKCSTGGSGSSTCLTEYFLKYRYPTPNKVILEGTDSVNQAQWERLNIGDSITLLISSENATLSSVNYAHGGGIRVKLWYAIACIGIFAFGVGIFMVFKRKSEL